MIISLLYLHYLGEAVDVADIPVMLVVGHVEGRRVARSSDHAKPQPEHMTSRFCPDFAGRKRRDGDKIRVCAAEEV